LNISNIGFILMAKFKAGGSIGNMLLLANFLKDNKLFSNGIHI